MLTYWLMYLTTAGMALFVSRRNQYNVAPWILIGFAFTLLIGFRYQVGGDWYNYLRHYDRVVGESLEYAMQGGDPGHKFLNWLAARWDLGVQATNIVYATVFMIGLTKFSRMQPYPWLAMAVATPYLITVVAMGYSRQAVAIGLFMWAVSYLDRGKFVTYIVMILIAALFHKTALLLLPLGVFLYGKGWILRTLMIIPVAYGAWDLLLADQQEKLWNTYVERQMASSGANIRVAMNLLPSLLLLMYRKEWKRAFDDYSFWFWIAIGSIATVGFVGAASTAVDRIALYFIPIQLVVYSRLPYLARKQIAPQTTITLILLVYAAVLFIWLNYAANAYAWVHYGNILFGDADY